MTIGLPIIAGLVIGLSFIGIWTWYLLTLPNTTAQLQYSPFENSGVWQCEDYDFTIHSYLNGTGEYDENGEEIEERIVEGILIKDEKSYEFDIYYHYTRGFNHNYAVVITIANKADSEAKANYSCYYDFKENEFVLKDLEYLSEEKVFEGIRELKFIKQS